MTTPIHDELKANWELVIKSAEARATIELKREIIAALGDHKRPTAAMKKLLEKARS